MRFKRIMLIMLCCLMVFMTSCSKSDKPDEEKNPVQLQENEYDIRGVWLTCFELSGMIGSGEKDYISNVEKMLDICDSKSLNTIFIHVRPFGDSIYPSDIFPESEYVITKSGDSPDFDVLETFIKLAHKRNYSVHAWINPYRLSSNTDPDSLSENSLAKQAEYINSVVFTSDGVYFEPSSDLVRETILSGVREILDNYDVDGIHIDDYFYPTTDKSFDEQSYEAYREKGGKLKLAQWRRENVNVLVASIYSLVHTYEGKIFTISPSGDIEKNINSHYADVKLWLKNKGYADIIIPQIYYGFSHEKMPFEDVADNWKKLEKGNGASLACGLAAYKQGDKDSLAGSGQDEWIVDGSVIKKQIESIEKKNYCGYVLFSYGYLK